MELKRISWDAAARKMLALFSQSVRRKAGLELHRLQRGELPRDSKPMQSIGPGVREIRVHDDNECRIIYVAKFEEAIYVLHLFEKKSQKTLKKDIDTARRRYRCILSRRNFHVV